MEFIEEAAEDPWCLHLSYIKPHCPYIAPSPYRSMYGHNDIKPVNHHPKERENPHHLMKLYMEREDSRTFSRQEARQMLSLLIWGS